VIWPFGALRPMGYGAILADPPWSYQMYSAKGYEKSPEAHYETMSDEALFNLPVADLAQRDCLLWLWFPWPKLPAAHTCIQRWGFNYVTGGVWMKRTKNDKLRWGPGYALRTVCEPFIIARLGDPQARLTDQPNAIGDLDCAAGGGIIINALAREHSRKPPQAREIVERMTPRAFRCELFGREAWAGNDVWGNEAAKFTAR
jgi:N6-adenosine-specific RNA methylase IME4